APPAFDLPADTAFYPDLSVTLSHSRPDAVIRYTTDGTDPDASSALYSAPLTLTDTTTVKARAFVDGFDPTAVAFETYTLSDIPRALDVQHMVLRMSDTNAWHYQTEYTQDGEDAVRSRAINDYEQTWMETDIQTPARVLFGWKTSSYYSDYLTLYTNGVMHRRIYGELEWAEVDQIFEQEGAVTLRWTYSKNYGYSSGQDAGFVDRLRIMSTNARIARFETAESFVRESDGSAQITVALDQAADADLEIPFAVSGTADGSDYTLTENTVTVPAGTNSAVISIPLADDDGAEMNETLVLTITETEEVASGNIPSCTVNILPNDFAVTQPGLIGWWRADTGVETNASGLVTRWRDQSGYNHAFVQADADRAPLWMPDAANGRPALRFDLVNDGMASGLNLQRPYTVYLLYASQNENTGARRALQGASNWLIGPYGGSIRHYAGFWVDDGSLSAEIDRLYLAMARNTGSDGAYWVDGVDYTSNSSAGSSPGLLYLGASGAYAEPFGGDLVEILVYDRALSTSDVVSVGAGLANTYDVETLYDPAAIVISTPSQALPDGTLSKTMEGSISGTASILFWTHTDSGASGSLEPAADGTWQ
ncbi:MAG TPA: chitobiase/beta-hexosaminidase C-terminal domain-containing protein, partial [Tichowtungia sp.]|nr:chitobiase/beta-hexosaminidase C-terminal domain-containing protein [Tichowtungia sp.]